MISGMRWLVSLLLSSLAVTSGSRLRANVAPRFHDARSVHRVLDSNDKIVFAQDTDSAQVFGPDANATAKFIVQLESSDSLSPALALLRAGDANISLPEFTASIHNQFTNVFPGLICTLSAAAASALSSLPGVLLLEQDQPVYADDYWSKSRFQSNPERPSIVNTGDRRRRAQSSDPSIVSGGELTSNSTLGASGVSTQTSAPWGLDRIDQISLPLDGAYSYADSGSNVDGEHAKE